jgi:2'-5' RNA ligase
MQGTQKYFIAIIPPEPLFSQIESLKKEISASYNTKASLRSPAHITLHMPFEWKEDKESELIRKLRDLDFNTAFNIELKNFAAFSPRVLFIDVVKNETLSALQKDLTQHMKTRLNIFNEAESERAFHPHLTIAFRDLRKNEFHKAWEKFKNETFDASFPVDSFWLLKHDGKRWNTLFEFQFITKRDEGISL